VPRIGPGGPGGRCSARMGPRPIRTGIREELNYTLARRVIELPIGRRRVSQPVPILLGARDG